MATVTKTMSPSEIEALYQRISPQARRISQPQYTHWQIRLSDMSVTAYQSGKVVFQGADVSWLADEAGSHSRAKTTGSSKTSSKKTACQSSSSASLCQTFPQAGSDEVGNGDYLGPFVVAAVIIPDAATAQKLEALQITDSKAMTDTAIRKVAPVIKTLVPWSIQILDNAHYNQIYNRDTMNLNTIKARMHNQAYLNLRNKGFTLPERIVIDQFCLPKTYYSHLRGVAEVISSIHFETKAESKYPAVAAASVLAREAFLRTLDQMEEKYGMPIAKGGGEQATRCAQKFVEKYGAETLSQIAKLHFSNTQKVVKR